MKVRLVFAALLYVTLFQILFCCEVNSVGLSCTDAHSTCGADLVTRPAGFKGKLLKDSGVWQVHEKELVVVPRSIKIYQKEELLHFVRFDRTPIQGVLNALCAERLSFHIDDSVQNMTISDEFSDCTKNEIVESILFRNGLHCNHRGDCLWIDKCDGLNGWESQTPDFYNKFEEPVKSLFREVRSRHSGLCSARRIPVLVKTTDSLDGLTLGEFLKPRIDLVAPIEKDCYLLYGRLCPGEVVGLAKLDAVKQIGLID